MLRESRITKKTKENCDICRSVGRLTSSYRRTVRFSESGRSDVSVFKFLWSDKNLYPSAEHVKLRALWEPRALIAQTLKLFSPIWRLLWNALTFNGTQSDIWNVDETGVTTVNTSNTVVGRNYIRWTRDTCYSRNSVPPFIVFPRFKYKAHFVRDGPVACEGDAYPSRWVDEKKS